MYTGVAYLTSRLCWLCFALWVLNILSFITFSPHITLDQLECNSGWNLDVLYELSRWVQINTPYISTQKEYNLLEGSALVTYQQIVGHLSLL